MDIQYQYTRKKYSGRGKRQSRDLILEKIKSKPCLVCSRLLERKTRRNGRLEGWANFEARKTCGRERQNESDTATQCLKSILTGHKPYNLIQDTKICSIDNCGKRHAAKGYCDSHYWKLVRSKKAVT